MDIIINEFGVTDMPMHVLHVIFGTVHLLGAKLLFSCYVTAIENLTYHTQSCGMGKWTDRVWITTKTFNLKLPNYLDDDKIYARYEKYTYL